MNHLPSAITILLEAQLFLTNNNFTMGHTFNKCKLFPFFLLCLDTDLHQYFFPFLPSVCPSTGGNVVRDPALRRRARATAKPLFTSSGSVGGLGKALNGSSASQGTGNFGF